MRTLVFLAMRTREEVRRTKIADLLLLMATNLSISFFIDRGTREDGEAPPATYEEAMEAAGSDFIAVRHEFWYSRLFPLAHP